MTKLNLLSTVQGFALWRKNLYNEGFLYTKGLQYE